MKIKEKYKLGLRWSSIDKNKDGVCSLFGACFFGAAVKEVKSIKDNDYITIDLTPQYSKILSSYYFVNLRWGSTNQSQEKIYLRDAHLTGYYVNKISNMDESYYILIDTENHEESVHMYNLVYKGYVVNREGEILEI